MLLLGHYFCINVTLHFEEFGTQNGSSADFHSVQRQLKYLCIIYFVLYILFRLTGKPTAITFFSFVCCTYMYCIFRYILFYYYYKYLFLLHCIL